MRVFPAFYPSTTAVTNFTTPAIPVGDNANLTAIVTITGTDVVGSFTVQGSVDQAFTRGVFLQAPTAVTTSTDIYISIPYVGLDYIRFTWTYTSGTGNIIIDVSIAEPMLRRGG
jgi:hypothetical protein